MVSLAGIDLRLPVARLLRLLKVCRSILASRSGGLIIVLRQLHFHRQQRLFTGLRAVQVRRQLVQQVDSLLFFPSCSSARMASNCQLVLLSFVLCCICCKSKLELACDVPA